MCVFPNFIGIKNIRTSQSLSEQSVIVYCTDMRERFVVLWGDGVVRRGAQLLRLQLEGGVRGQAQGRHAAVLTRFIYTLFHLNGPLL